MEDALVVDVETAATAHTALAGLLARHDPAQLVAGPELRAAATKLGLRVAPLDRSAATLRASQAVAMGNLDLRAETSALVGPLLMSLLMFHEAAPWRWIDSDRAVRVTFQRGRKRERLEAAVLGNAGEVTGLALYDRPGSLARHGHDPLNTPDCVLLTFDDEPAWAAETVRDSLGLSGFPALLRMRNGQPAEVRAEDVLRLESVLWGVSKLKKQAPVVEGEREDGELTALVRVELESPSPPPSAPRRRQKIPRNARCPCGSGRKYKRCCLAKDEAEARSASRVEALATRQDLINVLYDFMADETPDHEARWSQALVGEPEVPSHLTSILVPMLFYDLPLRGEEGETLIARFLTRRGRHLSPTLRRQLEAAHASWPSIWEVLAIDPGQGLELIDRFTGERGFVHEAAGTRNMPLRAGLLVRVTQIGERRELEGFYPYTMPPRETDAVVKELRRELKARTKWIPREQLTSPAVAQSLFRLWHARAEARHDRPEEPVELVNTDGDPLEFVEDRYALLDAPERVVEALLAIEGMVDEGEDEAGERALALLRPGNAMHRTWVSTRVGQVQITGETLTSSGNSQARADALRDLVEGQLGLLARFVERRRQPPEPRMQPGGGRLAMDSQPSAGWMQAPMDLVHRLSLRDWAQQPRDELDGLSPAAAVSGVASRRKLHRLLCEREFEAPEAMWGVLAEFREELGLDELGGRLRRSPRQRIQSTSTSRMLLEFALPLVIGSEDPSEAEAMMWVAAEVWNLAEECGASKAGRAKIRAAAREALAEAGLEVEADALQRWVEVLTPLRELFDDPRVVKIVDFDHRGQRFDFRAAALLPR